MSFYKSSNPALNDKKFDNLATLNQTSNPVMVDDQTMTVAGSINKTAILAILALASAMYTWNLFTKTGDPTTIQPYIIAGSIAGFIVALIIIFKQTTAPILAPVYAILEGLFLGGISAYFDSQYPGIVP